MWTYRARIVDMIDRSTVVAEIDLGFSIRTEQRITLADVTAPNMYSVNRPRATAQIEDWIRTRAGDDPWPFVLTLERVIWRDPREVRECYIGTITTPNGDSLNEHMVRWASDSPF